MRPTAIAREVAGVAIVVLELTRLVATAVAQIAADEIGRVQARVLRIEDRRRRRAGVRR
jgi:hypothetical protein